MIWGENPTHSWEKIISYQTDLPKRSEGTWCIHLLPLVLYILGFFKFYYSIIGSGPFQHCFDKLSQLCHKKLFSQYSQCFVFLWVCFCTSKATNDYASSIPFGREHLNDTWVPFSFVFLNSFSFLFYCFLFVWCFMLLQKLVNHGLFVFLFF